ncbi:MAG: hypothetical protein HKN32_05195 [Flavobacteriales bacterium]|nr:hypothetical protein [Flavobacteriales bacterium]
MKQFLSLTILALVATAALGQQYQVFINEVLASNQTDLQDDFFENDDWFELYFPAGQGTAVLNLAGYYLSDDPDSLDKFMIPDDNVWITADNHRLFFADNDPEQGPDHTNFKFTLEGEAVYLTEPDATTIVDSVWFPEQAPDISYGRVCDGCDEWMFFNNTTPDAVNAEVPQEAEFLFINEVLTVNTESGKDQSDEYDQWFEVYNPNDYQVNLAGYYISNTSDELLYQIPNTDPVKTVIGAGSWRLIWCDAQVEQGTNHAPFTLSTEGGTLTLVGPDATTMVDSYDFPAGSADVSHGRQTDGSPSSISFNIPTPRVTNSLVIIWPEELYINELLADNFSDTTDNYLENEDWFEIYNPNDFPVDLVGYYFTDNPEVPMKWQVPEVVGDSTVVPANGWLLFWCDEDGGGLSSQGWNHVSFKLNNNAEQLQMRGPDGFTIADEIAWMNQLDDISMGRSEDGGSSWINFEETTPEYSNNGAQVGVEEADANVQRLLLYPNPVNNGWVSFSQPFSGVLFDSSGRIVDQLRAVQAYNVDQLQSGVYILRSADGRSLRMVVE